MQLFVIFTPHVNLSASNGWPFFIIYHKFLKIYDEYRDETWLPSQKCMMTYNVKFDLIVVIGLLKSLNGSDHENGAHIPRMAGFHFLIIFFFENISKFGMNQWLKIGS